MGILFDLDFAQQSKMELADGKITKYTDNSYEFLKSGTSDVILTEEGIRFGEGPFADSGSKLQINQNIPFNHAFLIFKEGRTIGTNAYNKVFLGTQENNSVTSYQNGLVLAMNNSLSFRSTFRKTNKFNLSHLKVAGQSVAEQQAYQPTIFMGPSGAFKAIKVKLFSLNEGPSVCIGAVPNSTINTTTYSQMICKKLVLADFTSEEGDDFFADLLTSYQIHNG